MLLRPTVSFGALAVALGALACSGRTGADDPASDGGARKAPSCPEALGGPKLAGVPSPDKPFCIDTTEVTNAQYSEFLGAGAGVNPTMECSWNESLVPAFNWPPEPGRDQHPVAFVDWCDAQAFCSWAGKRLCGSVHGGGAVPWQDPAGVGYDPSEGEWYTVCSGGGKYPELYDKALLDQTPCKAGVAGAEVAVPVTSAGSCHSPDTRYSTVFDMVGNVAEWENDCEPGADPRQAFCFVRGGSYSHLGPWDCVSPALEHRDSAKPTIGLRCCADPVP